MNKSDSAVTVPPWIKPRSAYLHIPFCAHHCGYCDFAIATGKDEMIDRYLDALSIELSWLDTPQSVRTIFLGGGTPTYLSCEQLNRLLNTIRHWLPLIDEKEFSIEANPDTLSVEKIELLLDHGVNRFSLGSQSFRREVLQVLDRRHNPEQIATCVEWLRGRASISMDLIFGAPGQSLKDWRQDLETALRFEIDHLSTYGLTYERGTPLWKRRERGEVQSLPEETEREMYAKAIDMLSSVGFEQYEISSFARPGRRCLHNQVYWANEAYFGFGMGAARYVERRRELNTRDLVTYIQRVERGDSPTFQSERLDDEERARETMAIQLRRVEGINRQRFQEQTEWSLDDVAGDAIARQVRQGFLFDDGERVALTHEGKFVADAVIEELL